MGWSKQVWRGWCCGIALLLCCAGCGGGTAAPVSPATETQWLPPPGGLRAVMATGTYHTGADYVPEWPQARVAAGGNAGVFTPDASAGGGIAGAAYAVYAFDASSFAGTATLNLHFSQTGPAGSAWAGLPDYQRGRWDWQPLPAPQDGHCALAVWVAQRQQGGSLPVAVLCTGSAPWRLERLDLTGPGTDEHPWPAPGQNAQHTSLSPYAGPHTPRLEWKFRTFGLHGDIRNYSRPVIGPDGTVYTCGKEGLYASTPAGELKWTAGGEYYRGGPVLGRDGSIYLYSKSSNEYCIDAFSTQGSLCWSLDLPDPVAELVVGPDGTLYACGHSRLYAVSNAGVQQWMYKAYGDISGMVFSPDGGIVFASNSLNLNNYSVYKLDAAGQLQWFYWLGGRECDPLVDAEGVIYVGNGYKLLALNPDGTEQWQYQTGGQVAHLLQLDADTICYTVGNDGLGSISPQGVPGWSQTVNQLVSDTMCLGPDGLLYLVSALGWMEGFDSHGIVRWVFSNDELINQATKFAFAENGVMYVGSGSKLFAVATGGSLLWTKGSGGSVYAGPAIAADGTIYLASKDHGLYAVDPDGGCKWRMEEPDEIDSLYIGRDNMLFVLLTNDMLLKYDPEGVYVLDFDSCGSQPVLTRNGNLYFGDWDALYAYRQDAVRLWTVPSDHSVSQVALGHDGTIYATSTVLQKLTSTGSKSWQCDPGLWIKWDSLMIAPDDRAYLQLSTAVSPYDYYFAAVSPAGSLEWVQPSVWNTERALLPDGSIAGYDWEQGVLQRLDATGAEMWSVECGAGGNNGITVGADGVIYLTDLTGTVQAWNADGTQLWTYLLPEASRTQPALGADGTLYVGCKDGGLYAFHD